MFGFIKSRLRRCGVLPVRKHIIFNEFNISFSAESEHEQCNVRLERELADELNFSYDQNIYSKSEVIRACIRLSLPTVKQHPELVKYINNVNNRKNKKVNK